jgi:hypothetical protein
VKARIVPEAQNRGAPASVRPSTQSIGKYTTFIRVLLLGRRRSFDTGWVIIGASEGVVAVGQAMPARPYDPLRG